MNTPPTWHAPGLRAVFDQLATQIADDPNHDPGPIQIELVRTEPDRKPWA